VAQTKKTSTSPCVVFVVWGDKYVAEVPRCVERSPGIAGLPVYLITDLETALPELPTITVIRADFGLEGHFRKSEMWKYLPKGYDTFVYLDTDITVVGDISFGFEKARKHGIAMVHSNSYLLDEFKTFADVMRQEGVEPRGMAQHNTGVIFFSREPVVEKVFMSWQQLCEKYFPHSDARRMTDQPYFSLAMEKVGLAPYTLVKNFNYRPNRDPVWGPVRVWHRWYDAPTNLNENPETWRRYDHSAGRMVPLVKPRPVAKKIRRVVRTLLRRLGLKK
jgi:hypothetical protein